MPQFQSQSFGSGPTQSAPVFDELRNPSGQLRSHWEPVFRDAPELQSPEFARRWREGQQLIRENGVTFNAYGDPKGIQRPWRLDPIPFVLPAHEAEFLERGLCQRARLFESILADLYGPRRLLKEGLIPPELVFANPGFQRPCHGVIPTHGKYLHLYAANIGRGDDGNWQVIRDRTQAPAGAGYVLENRIVVSRVLPEAFQSCRVQRMALFFQTLLNTLRSIAPKNRDNPRIVLLTPGPLNETYFEHSYLARYLGITLAESGDLTVRDRQLYLKVLGGLQPVDVLFRRLDDEFCDPLELRPDSSLGVPGLLQAIRCGNVALANALGCGVLEMPALLPYLPNLARALLSEDLALPTVETRWCGDPESLRYVLDHPEQIVLKSAFTSFNRPTILLDECSAEDRTKHLAQLKAEPHRFAAQRRLPLSTVPILTDSGTENRRLIVRLFLAADRDGFQMLPGGLSCFGANPESRSVSMSQGGGSKDTWVLASGPVSTFSLLPPGDRPIELTRAGGDLPSRAADNLFWLGRYAERAEGSARLLRGALSRLLERAGPADRPEVPLLLNAAVARVRATEVLISEEDPEDEIAALVYHPAKPGGLAGAVIEWHRVAGLVRDRMSLDMWRVVSAVQRTILPGGNPERVRSAGETLDALDKTIVHLAAFGGLASESMTRGEGWRFLDLGRKLERAMNLVDLVRCLLAKPLPTEGLALDAALEIADARMTYRRRYLGQLRVEAVLDLILFDETNPRALVAILADILDDVDRLPRSTADALRSPEQRLALLSLAAVQLAAIPELVKLADGERPHLKELLGRLSVDLPELSNNVTLRYLSHLQASRQLAQGEAAAP